MHSHGEFQVGECAIFETALATNKGVAKAGDVVRIECPLGNWSVGTEEDGRDDVGYAVSCEAWGRSFVHPEGFWFCKEEWLRKIIKQS